MAAAWRREKAGDWSEEGSGKELLVAPGIWDSSLLVSVNQNGERDWLLPVVIVIIVIVIVIAQCSCLPIFTVKLFLPVGANLGARGERRPWPSSAVGSWTSSPRLRSSPSSVRRDSWGRDTVLLLIFWRNPSKFKCLRWFKVRSYVGLPAVIVEKFEGKQVATEQPHGHWCHHAWVLGCQVNMCHAIDFIFL